MKIFDILGDENYKNKKVLEKVICHYLNIDKSTLFAHYETEIQSDLLEKIISSYEDYTINKKPLEFIFGFVEFLGNKFHVNQNTLIPRPETEYMILGINEFIQSNPEKKYQLIDLGTGCGVLGNSVLFFNQKQISRTILSDVSEKAVDVAKTNYSTLFQDSKDIDITFITSDMLNFLENKEIANYNNPSIIVANLPYIPDNTFDTEVEDNVKKREPRMAFVGGQDGLDRYRVMFSQMKQYIDPSRITDYTMFLEMCERQVDILDKEYGHEISFDKIATFHFNIKIVKASFRQ